MSTLNLTSYSRETLEHLLLMMKSYRSSLKQIGKRTVLIDPENPPAIAARIEYPSSMEDSFAKEYAQGVLKYAFPAYDGASPLLSKNDSLTGGARVFVGDDMVDVSFQKLESLLK